MQGSVRGCAGDAARLTYGSEAMGGGVVARVAQHGAWFIIDCVVLLVWIWVEK